MYRCLIDGLFGLQGHAQGLQVRPQLPEDWNEASVTRLFRGAKLNVNMKKDATVQTIEVYVDGERIEGDIIKNIQAGVNYEVLVKLPL